MKRLIITLAVLALIAGVASARMETWQPREARTPGRVPVIWSDDIESGAPGWTHGDGTATAVPHFHVDTYMAFAGQYSWWCGTFAYDANGGYGNSWDDRLDIPPTAWPVGAYEVLTFAYRNDTEPAYDFSYVQAESGGPGAWVNLNRGFDGIHPWGTTGFYLGNKDNPAVCRFRVVSDGAYSDGDGLYLSVGGAFACDDIQIWDYNTGNVHFFDDVETGGVCVPGVPAAAGDYWHIIDNPCKSFSPTHCWANTSVDTNGAFVPPGVQNWLMTPWIDISGVSPAWGCTTGFIIQFFTPTVDNDYWTEEVSLDGGVAWTQLHAWWGDQCDSGYTPCDHFLGGDDVSALMPGTLIAHRWTYYTTDNGCGPDVCDCAGITIDDAWFETTEASPVQETTWGRVKSMWRR